MLPDLSIWDAINIVTRLGIVGIVIWKQLFFYTLYNWEERVGLGVIGGCMLMTIPAIFYGPNSAYGEWASALSAFGVLVYFVGRARRQTQTMRAIRAMNKLSPDYSVPVPNKMLSDLVHKLARNEK